RLHGWGAAAAVWLGSASCAHRGRESREVPDVEVTSLAAAFPGAEEGRFDVSLTVREPSWAGARATGVTWEAWIHRRLFASGRVALSELFVDPARPVVLSLPVVYRHLGYRPGPTKLRILFRGALELERGTATWAPGFERMAEVTTEGAPMPASGLDADR
ncbi:MAG TPA: hypothetical protein VEY30_11905, partial [Myxococcaceae bacterium]|nr:hypothetical protein [Myxococcaceae bacterium]